jgi:hypothetical protein
MFRTLVCMQIAILTTGLAVGLQAQVRSSAATIEVIGGPHAGKYTLNSTDSGCLISERGKGAKKFSVNFGIPPTDPRSKDPKALTSINVDIRNVTATAPPPSDYLAQMTFGPVMDTRLGKFYLSGSNPTSSQKGGPGTVMFKESGGKDATVSFDLAPESGIVVKGTITCTNPLRY